MPHHKRNVLRPVQSKPHNIAAVSAIDVWNHPANGVANGVGPGLLQQQFGFNSI
jgi:hypothetical protein